MLVPAKAFPTLAAEEAAGRGRGLRVVGVDEVGRGPLAGPVVACAVLLPDDLAQFPKGINDSKAVSAKKRAVLAAQLVQLVPYALGEASVAEIDEINILQATFLAMKRAVLALQDRLGTDCPLHHALIDGPHIPKNFPVMATPVVGGDAVSLSIAAASIIAKEYRDQLMVRLDAQYPGYGWASNAGYGSAGHLQALGSLGVTPHHRRSFAPVTRLLNKLEATA
jgi:ribonuclease HII